MERNFIYETMKRPIFISYKRMDFEHVAPIKDRIEKETGAACWIDTDGIESDAQFMNVIIEAIKDCEIFLFFYSKSHLKNKEAKDWPMRELKLLSY